MKIILTPTDDFDKALAANREPGTEFVLTQGIYKTRGNWYFEDWTHLASGCKLVGNGSTIILDPVTVTRHVKNQIRPDRDLNVFWVGSNTFVENLVIDGNEKSFADVNDPSKTWYVTTGLRSLGKTTVENVIVQNIRGTFSAVNTLTKEIESFGISTTGNDGGSIINRCTVQSCPENSYVSAISAGHVGPNVSRSFIRDCKINIEKNNWFGFGINCNVSISNCEIVSGPRIAIYNDTLETENCNIKDCKFNNVDKLVSLIIPPGSSSHKRNIKIADCWVKFSSGDARHLIELWDQNTNAPTVKRQQGPIAIKNVRVELTDSNTKLYIAVVGSDIRPITLIDCNIPVNIENMAGNMLSVF